MIKDLLFLFTGIAVASLFVYLRGKIMKQITTQTKEHFDTTKFKEGLFNVKDKVGWAKDFVSEFNLRKIIIRLTIISIIVGVIYGYGWYQGRLNTPVKFDLRGQEAHIQLNDHYLHILENGTAQVEDKHGAILKEIAVKDIPELRRALKPYGFQFKPIGIIGYGVSTEKKGFEGGAGISFLKYWKWQIETFLTQYGIYLGSSYQITNNSGLGIGAGKGYDGDNRIIIYYRWRF